MAVKADINAKHVLNRALFPVSAGAVVAEIVTLFAVAMKSGFTAELGGWAGLAAAALMFQIATRKKQ